MISFFVNVMIVVFAILFVVLALYAFGDWREKRQRTRLPRPPDDEGGLFEPGRAYVVTLKSGERVGPARFEGYGTLHDDGIPHSQLSFRKPDGKRLVVIGLAVRLVEEVDDAAT